MSDHRQIKCNKKLLRFSQNQFLCQRSISAKIFFSICFVLENYGIILFVRLFDPPSDEGRNFLNRL